MKQTGSSAIETANFQGIVFTFALFFGTQSHIDARDLVGFVGQGDTPTQGVVCGFLRFECVHMLAMVGQSNAVGAGMGTNVQYDSIRVTQLLGPFNQTFFEEAVVSIIVDVGLGQNIHILAV